MLEDFITSNDLNANIINKSVRQKIKCQLFLNINDKNLSPLIAIFPFYKQERIEKYFFKKEYRKAEVEETQDITGYKEKYLPPVSVFGVKVLIDKELIEKKQLIFPVGTEKSLLIEPQDILSTNKEIEIAEF